MDLETELGDGENCVGHTQQFGEIQVEGQAQERQRMRAAWRCLCGEWIKKKKNGKERGKEGRNGGEGRRE